ncbi:MAG: DNA polymerase III subunit beta, partial [Parcubacteria group bacterium]|nr:DNA polymerase III subunit beta [Parcubacteria group bacterium]
YKATFQGLDPEEFPIIPKIQNESKLFIPNEGLKTALTQVVNAASTSETRQELAGVFCQYDPEGTLKFVATDSFRLAEKTYQLNGTNSPKVKIAAFLPLRSAQEVIRVSQDRSGDVGIAIDQNQILFSWEDTEFTSRLLEAEFPAYASIIPKQFLSEVGVSRKKFLEALRVTGVFSSKINDVKISIQPPDKMVLRAANAAVGENEAVLPADIRGQAGEAAFNYKFLIDGVENIFQDKVVFGVNQDTAPALIRGEADPSYFYLIMPIRL